ncbi:copper amine oxidase N-terminal domain-containing protein [Heliophilum fasciatum]|uniref:Copper amine oxidase-like protein n=1 Tax=Heliophilum fasciatum TaxID=35700 RepID=A0A4R2RIV1_9FIRM|nr:copper amine oxidase N-terminal domain-containing protein [Heliophilum fasciatum]MCW2278640.1 hypothetical protein [Heliophilum fasciatum]TCP62658.1 copper amine oxidase-like protein [Heliophilum fasciatum]
MTVSIIKTWRTKSLAAFLVCTQLIGFTAGATTSAEAASPAMSLAWEELYGGKEQNRGYATCITSDHGFALVGQAVDAQTQYTFGDADIYLAKTDKTGYLQWEKMIGDYGPDTGTAILATADGGYIIGGSSQVGFKRYDNAYLLKLNASAKKEWDRKIGGEADVTLNDLQIANDGAYVMTGTIDKHGSQRADLYAAKIDTNGKVVWEKSWGGKDDEHGKAIRPTADGGLMILGETSSRGQGGYDLYLMKIDANGKEQWSKTYGGKAWDIAESMEATMDGGYILVGRTASFNNGDYDTYIVKTDGGGNLMWEKSFGQNGWDVAMHVEQSLDGGYYIAGWTESKKAGKYDLFLLRLDGSGNRLSYSSLANDKFSEQMAIGIDEKGGLTVTGIWAEELKWNQAYKGKEAVNAQAYLANITVAPAIQSVQRDKRANLAVNIVVDGKEFVTTMNPLNREGQIFVDAEDLAKALGASFKPANTVEYITLQRDGKEIRFVTDRKEVKVNDDKHQLTVPAFVYGPRYMVPLRWVCEQWGVKVGWDESTRSVTLTAPKLTP